jgi:predicted DsbA family dithiol-disulfide isomerase
MAEKGMYQLGLAAGIKFNYEVLAQWQPVESQRLLLWSGRYGLQEEYMSALNKRHFEQKQSASDRRTLLEAAREVGLDVQAAETFLDSDELEDVVWKSYGRTIREHGIHSIPLFAMSVPAIDAIGGPMRPTGTFPAYVVRGSMDRDYFVELFEVIMRDIDAGKRVFDQRATPYSDSDWNGPASGSCSM